MLDVAFDELPITLDVPFGGSPIVDTGWSPQESSTALFPSELLFPSESLYPVGPGDATFPATFPFVLA